MAMESLAAPLLCQRGTVFAPILRCLEDGPVAGHDASSARGITLTPRLPLADLAVQHWNGERDSVELAGI